VVLAELTHVVDYQPGEHDHVCDGSPPVLRGGLRRCGSSTEAWALIRSHSTGRAWRDVASAAASLLRGEPRWAVIAPDVREDATGHGRQISAKTARRRSPHRVRPRPMGADNILTVTSDAGVAVHLNVKVLVSR
jgi:hypothetical protein